MVPTPLVHAVEILKALGPPARLRIVALLREGPLSVCQIGAVLGSASSTVSGHLLDLRRAGLVAERRQGKWVYYRLEAEPSARVVVEALLSDLVSDPQVSEDQSIAAVLRAQSPAPSCESAPPDSPRRLPGHVRSDATRGSPRSRLAARRSQAGPPLT